MCSISAKRKHFWWEVDCRNQSRAKMANLELEADCLDCLYWKRAKRLRAATEYREEKRKGERSHSKAEIGTFTVVNRYVLSGEEWEPL